MPLMLPPFTRCSRSFSRHAWRSESSGCLVCPPGSSLRNAYFWRSMHSEGTLEKSISFQRCAHMYVSVRWSCVRRRESIRRYLAWTWCPETSMSPWNMTLQISLSARRALLCFPPSDGAYFAKRDLWSAALFERSFQVEQVTAELIRKEQPHLRVHLAVATRQSFEKLREQVFPVPVFRNEVHEVQNHVGKELV